jgi:hypothetical protein
LWHRHITIERIPRYRDREMKTLIFLAHSEVWHYET